MSTKITSTHDIMRSWLNLFETSKLGYCGSVQGDYGDTEVYCNPSKKQYWAFVRSIANFDPHDDTQMRRSGIRGCVDAEGNLYCWDSRVFHMEVWNSRIESLAKLLPTSLTLPSEPGDNIVSWTEMDSCAGNDEELLAFAATILNSKGITRLFGSSWVLRGDYDNSEINQAWIDNFDK